METDHDNNDEKPSKTQRKQEMHALQQLGERLTGFREAQLDLLPLGPELRSAIREYRRLPNSHHARRRQLQFIGRLMRDYDLAVLEDSISKAAKGTPPDTGRRKFLQECGDQILHGGDDGINNLLREQAHLERQNLRNFHLNYLKAAEKDDTAAMDNIREKVLNHLDAKLP